MNDESDCCNEGCKPMTMIQLSLFDFQQLRHCPKCKQDKPATLDYFGSNKARKDGFQIYCRPCLTEYNREYRKKNATKIKATKRAEYLVVRNDPEKWAARLERSRLQRREYRKTEKWQQKQREYRVANRKKRNAYNREWYDQNPGKRREHYDNYYNRLTALPDTLTNQQWESALKYWQDKCCYCGDDATERDHFIPVSYEGENPGTVMGNVVPACRSCNAMKHDKLPLIFLRSIYDTKQAQARLVEIYKFYRMFIRLEDVA